MVVGRSGTWSGTAKRAVAGDNDIAFVRPARATLLSLAIHRGAEEVRSWIDAGGVDIVVLGIFAHGDLVMEGFSALLIDYSETVSVDSWGKTFSDERTEMWVE